MGTIGVVLLVFFVIVCLLLVLLVSIQDDGENGMGLLGGRGTAAFGSHSASVLTKTTFVLVFLFFALSFALAMVNKKPKLENDLVPATAVEATESATETSSSDWWAESESAE
jgi:preprotein translocase subunit SecG